MYDQRPPGLQMLCVAPIAMAVTLAAAAAAAQTNPYPTRPVTIIVPYAPGGTTDVVGRALADSLSRQLKQSFVVENKPGAAGAMGVIDMMTASPDGYRLTMAPVGIFRQPHIQKTPYDPIRDLTYVASFLTYDFAVTVPAKSPFKTIHDLVEHARKHPDEVTYGSTGQFTGNHVVLAALAKEEDLKLTHVPYRGDSDATAGLLGGQTTTAVITNSILQYVRSGTVRVLATSDAERNPAFGEVPTLLESGYQVVVPSPLGIAGPAGMPREVVDTLDKAIQQALEEPSVKNVIDNLGVRTYYMGHERYTAFASETFEAEKGIVEILN